MDRARNGRRSESRPRPFPSPVFSAFQPAKAPFMLWDESSFPNTSGPGSSNMTVKVRVLGGPGPLSGWAGGL